MMYAGVLDTESTQQSAPQYQIQSNELLRRAGDCDAAQHPCGTDFNSTLCCDNLSYCIVNKTSLAVQCCSLGSTCGSGCDQNYFYSPVAATTVQNTAAATLPIIGTSGVCVKRKCTGTTYQCPEDLGGQCCPFGSDCASGGLCAWSDYEVTAAPSTTATTTDMLQTSTTRSTLPTSTALDAPTTADDMKLKIGLGVGIPLAIICVTVLAIVWRFRRVRRRGDASKVEDQEEYRKPELHGHEFIPPAELETHAPELPAQILEAELPEQGIVAELPVPALLDSRSDSKLTEITVTESERPSR